MPEEDLGQLNWQLAHPAAADAAVTRHMGLFAVAHLAARHGITVALELPPDGGTAADVYLPATLIVPEGPGPVPGPRAGTVASPGTPLAVPAWQRAEPEGTEQDRAGQDSPERTRGQRGGALPIFESVESDYPRWRAPSCPAGPAGRAGQRCGG